MNSDRLLKFENCGYLLDKTQEHSLWKFLIENDLKLKDVRFRLDGCAIGTSIFICDEKGIDLLDITDYHSW